MSFDIRSFDEAKKHWETCRARKMDWSCWLEKNDDGSYAVRYYNTQIIKWYRNATVFDSGGWHSSTTFRRMYQWGSLSVGKNRGVPYVYPSDNHGDNYMVYQDGMVRWNRGLSFHHYTGYDIEATLEYHRKKRIGELRIFGNLCEKIMRSEHPLIQNIPESVCHLVVKDQERFSPSLDLLIYEVSKHEKLSRRARGILNSLSVDPRFLQEVQWDTAKPVTEIGRAIARYVMKKEGVWRGR